MSAIACSAQIVHSKLPTKLAVNEVGSPLPLDPALWAQVGGGAPKGGWLSQDSGGYVLDKIEAPKGGW